MTLMEHIAARGGRAYVLLTAITPTGADGFVRLRFSGGQVFDQVVYVPEAQQTPAVGQLLMFEVGALRAPGREIVEALRWQPVDHVQLEVVR